MSVSSAMPANAVSLASTDQIPTGANGISGANSSLNENNFLTLMTTQLENQDPLNPMSSSDFAAELAQFSTATGVQSLNTAMSGLSGIQAANLVGHNVAVNGDTLLLGTSGTASGAFNLPSAAAAAIATITDATGRTVDTIKLGALGSGNQSFTWDGKLSDGSTAPQGTYLFNVAAVNAAGVALKVTPYTIVPVTGVALGGTNGPMLDVGDGVAPVALSAVQQVF